MNNYFTLEDNFEKIVSNTFKNDEIKSINKVATGWTNIVFEVITDKGDYFFRFPRDDFWSRTIVKDYEFSKFIKGKTDYQTVELELYYDEGRPFSVHKKIEGRELADIMNDLSEEEIKDISRDIAKFMYQLHQVPYENVKIFDVNNIAHDLIDFLDELLVKHVDPNDMNRFWNRDEFSKKTNDCLVHGDLNSSNVIIGDDNKVKAFIDFGFGGYGNKYYDIARIIGRCTLKFKDYIVKSYEEFSNKKLDEDILNEEIQIWSDIDNSYINYMRKIGIYN